MFWLGDTTAFFSSAAVEAASRKHGLLTRGLECVNPDGETVQGTNIGAISEWGNEFESFTCSGPPEGRHCCELGLPQRKVKPANRFEALEMMDAYFNCRCAFAAAACSRLSVRHFQCHVFPRLWSVV